MLTLCIFMHRDSMFKSWFPYGSMLEYIDIFKATIIQKNNLKTMTTHLPRSTQRCFGTVSLIGCPFYKQVWDRGAPIKFFPIPIRSDIFICIFPDTDTDHRYTAGYTGGIKKLSIYSHLLIIATCRIDFNWNNSATANKMLHGNYLKINLFQIYMLPHTVHELYYTTQGLKFCTVFHTGMISQGLLMRSKKKIKKIKKKKLRGCDVMTWPNSSKMHHICKSRGL